MTKFVDFTAAGGDTITVNAASVSAIMPAREDLGAPPGAKTHIIPGGFVIETPQEVRKMLSD
jgi:hypothetical protein